MIDASQFLKNERANEYEVTIVVHGTMRMMVEANSLAEARQKAEEIIEADDFDGDLDDVDDADVQYVRKTPTMFLVLRDGKPMQVSHLLEGDLPRQPIEHGF